jgi:hypothetical protein
MWRVCRAIFAAVDAVGDAAEKAATGVDAASVRSRFEANLALKRVLKHLAKCGTNLATNLAMTRAAMKAGKEETTASAAATVQDAAAPIRDSSAQRPPAAWAATTITDHPPDISRLCCPVNQSLNTSA